jgi:amino acid adenylation domain-containing protein
MTGRSANGPVALLLEPDDRSIAALLGILKAGTFYVPLDPSYPPERLSFILEDCQPGLLITDDAHEALARRVAPGGCAVVLLDDIGDGSTEENPCVVVLPDALAAVFYTSGSTGRPKGVMQTHRLVLHRVMVDTNCLCISPDDRLSLLSSPSYSVSLRHLFGGLLNGASVCPFDVRRLGFHRLAAVLKREEVTIYFSVPTVFRELIATVHSDDALASVRVLHLGGEIVTAKDFDLYVRHLPANCLFMNSLASNETGILTIYLADKSKAMQGDVPVGYPVDDKELLILDEDGREVPRGRSGQIAVRSACLSPGYWRQPELTAAAFRTDAHGVGLTIYRTGDRGRLLPDGCLVYQGRGECRVKVRGIRVEVEDVEAALRGHDMVEQVAVVSHEDGHGSDVLVAFVVANRGATLQRGALRSFLADRLPGHMIPSAFVLRSELPHTPNGKIDRLALRSVAYDTTRITTSLSEPQDQLERELTRLFEAALGIHSVGARENFFDLGLDSLGVLRLVAEIEDAFDIRIPMSYLFDSPTVSELAAKLRGRRGIGQSSSMVPIRRRGRKPPFFWIHGDMSAPLLARVLGPDQPFYALEHQSQDGRLASYTDVETIAAYYLREMRKIQPTGPYFLGGYSFGGVVALEVAKQAGSVGDRVSLLVLLDPPSLATSRGTGASADWKRAGVSRRGDVVRQLRRLAALSFRAQLAYVRQRAIGLGRLSGVAAGKRSLQRAAALLYAALGLRLPVYARSRYILEIYARALARYVPPTYSGPCVLFNGIDRRYEPAGDWPEILRAADLQTHEVKAGHTEMREGPHVGLWADKLGAALSAAQHTRLDAAPAVTTRAVSIHETTPSYAH